MAVNLRSEKRNGRHIIKPKATIGQMKVAEALQPEPAMQLPRKQSKIEVPIYDISLLLEAFEFDEDEKAKILSSIKTKCSSRGITPYVDSLSAENVRERAKVGWAALALEIGEDQLPDFDGCFSRVETLYRSLPWE